MGGYGTDILCSEFYLFLKLVHDVENLLIVGGVGYDLDTHWQALGFFDLFSHVSGQHVIKPIIKISLPFFDQAHRNSTGWIVECIPDAAI